MEKDIETTDERYYVVVLFDHFKEVIKLPHERERVISMVGSDYRDMKGKEFAER